uniref:Uncharacterized protein n=1 Tax=Siphoviridae sp. ctVif31 TaxID=2825532 RepID=A0A8S5Q452_9CAUD|nr:MAG TPA: hypothetical protein [Siphoviridae sp. ctVif31]
MLIRSQDKTALVKFENIVVNLKLPDSLNIICWSLQDAQRSGGYFVLGTYSTKEKAMKVLDMIQDAYMEYKSGEIVANGLAGSAYTGSYDTKESVAHGIAVLKGYGNEIRKSILFQMPEDSEVEV